MNEKYLSVMNETVWRHDEEHAFRFLSNHYYYIGTSNLQLPLNYYYRSLSLSALSLSENHILA